MLLKSILKIHKLFEQKNTCKICNIELPKRNTGLCHYHLKEIITQINQEIKEGNF